MKRPEKRYDHKNQRNLFKENAVKRANESANIAQTARKLGITWVHKYSRPVETAKVSRSDEHLYDKQKRLKKVVRVLRRSTHSKKAATYFAKETRC